MPGPDLIDWDFDGIRIGEHRLAIALVAQGRPQLEGFQCRLLRHPCKTKQNFEPRILTSGIVIHHPPTMTPEVPGLPNRPIQTFLGPTRIGIPSSSPDSPWPWALLTIEKRPGTVWCELPPLPLRGEGARPATAPASAFFGVFTCLRPCVGVTRARGGAEDGA